MPKLGVNIDHVATLRQARREFEPDLLAAARICKKAGVDSLVCHLREDRRHIQDADVFALKKLFPKNLTLELSLNPQIMTIAARVKPHIALLVPESRQEVTTEGGLDVVKHFARTKKAVRRLQKNGILVSVFIAPVKKQIEKSKESGAEMIELHTGTYANAKNKRDKNRELARLKSMARFAKSIGLIVNAGHGLKYHDTRVVAKIKEIEELNIGHSIVSRAVFTGMEVAVREMKRIVYLR